jgi:superfamily II DNA/RNA helicase
MPNNRPAIPIATQRAVLFEARHHCAVCCNPLALEQAHIIPWSKSKDHSAANLIAVCANCHTRADGEKWGIRTLKDYKKNPCILARKSNAPEGTSTHMVQLVEMLVKQEMEEMTKRSPEFASMIGGYTRTPGRVKVRSVKKANSSVIIIELPPDAARVLIEGFKQQDPLLRSFLDDIELLDVRALAGATIALPTRRVDATRHSIIHAQAPSSDLTFITNEQGRSLADRFSVLLGNNTRAFDCLVGYFYLSGFRRLSEALKPTEKIRILIGLSTDQPTFELLKQAKDQMQMDLRSHAETKERIPAEILSELENVDDSTEVETGVRQFIEWVKSGKLQVRVFPSAQLHAKLYIMSFVDGHIDKGRVVTGSSNFSQSGLVDNLEFNVELKNRADYEFALAKFNELWQQAVEVSETYVQTIDLRSPFAQFTPYELFLKFLYEYFKTELSRSEETDPVYLPIRFKKLKYQDDAVTAARRTLDEYGGVFLSDVVGLGKTYMAALLAQQLPGRTLVIAPPALLDDNNPGSWPNVFRDFRVPQARFQSGGKLDELIRQGVDNYDNVFIDESHRFRTETNQTYEKLAQICRGKRVILVSATPLNNHPHDILSQVKLFQNGKASTIPNVRNLEAFFGRLVKKLKGLDRQRDREEYFAIVRENAREIREKVLKYLMIRRTRTEISRYYAADLAAQSLRFPEIAAPEPLFYQLNTEENRIFNHTITRLAQDFTYARYCPLIYYQGDRGEGEVVAQENLAKFMKILLVKRLESSVHAFRLTIDRFIRTYEHFLAAHQRGKVFISKKHIGKIFELLEQDDLAKVQELIEADLAEELSADDFSEKFPRDLANDLAILREIRDLWSGVQRDPKWLELASALREREVLRTNRIILFTESKETATYLADRLRQELNEKVIVFHGSSDASVREELIRNFDARVAKPAEDYRILVTTEVLAEGVSLHRANVVLNYDIPWNPTRLIQRVGRVNRVDTAHDRIHTFHFFPTEEANDVIKLREAAEAKIQAFIEMLGADAQLLTEGEEIKSHDLFQQLFSKSTITGEDEQQESELEYLTLIRRIRDEQLPLFERIKHLPKKARSGRVAKAGETAPALLTYFRKGRLEKFFIAGTGDKAARELDFLATARLLSCEPDAARADVGPDFYPLLDVNKAAFEVATTEDGDGQPAQASRDTAAKLLTRLRTREVRNFPGYTEDDEEYVRQVTRLLEDGALPRPTLKKLAEAFKTEAHPLKLLGIMRRDIPPQFFQATRAEQVRHNFNPREVILSEYLVAK